MMFMRSVVLGSAVIVALASSVDHVVDDADIKINGATLEPLEKCPVTEGRTFHHDGMQKDRRANATFHFDPPRDGCYLIEQRTGLDNIKWTSTHYAREQNKKCEASSNTTVHVHYCKGLQAAGVVDQTPKGFGRQPQDQWTFIAALPFYKGHPGNVTLSNEGTKPGTLTVFDQVRFMWSGHDCVEAHVHPRRAEIRLSGSVDFLYIADRLTIFGIALKKRLADMAGVPDNALRLTDLRAGSIIAEFLIIPQVMEDHVVSASDSIELLRKAIYQNWAELCALTSAPLEGCEIELHDLGFAVPSAISLPKPKQHSQVMQQEETEEDDEITDVNVMIIVVATFAAAGLLLFAIYRLYKARSAKADNPSSYGTKVQVKQSNEPVDVSIEEGQSAQEKPADLDYDDKSTVCPSVSDKQSDPGRCDDIENASTPSQTVVKITSKRSRDSSRA
jgi:hypothetical protein